MFGSNDKNCLNLNLHKRFDSFIFFFVFTPDFSSKDGSKDPLFIHPGCQLSLQLLQTQCVAQKLKVGRVSRWWKLVPR